MSVIVKIEAAARAWRMADNFEPLIRLTDTQIGDLNRMAAEVLISTMLKESYVSICTIDKLIALVPGASKACPEYRILHAIHCVNLADVPKALRDQVPTLIRAVLTAVPPGVAMN